MFGSNESKASEENLIHIHSEKQLMGVSMQFLIDFKIRREIGSRTSEKVCNDIIMPETLDGRASYIDLVIKENVNDFIDDEGSFIGPATVFVSHAWKYDFVEVIEAVQLWWVEHGSNPKVYFWIDLFCNNQHAIINSFEWLETTFRSSVASIGHMLVVLLPWDGPLYTQRAWCLYEFYAGVMSQSKMEILLSTKQKRRFAESICGEEFHDKCIPSFFHIDFEKAEASVQSDKDAIMKIVKNQIGINRLNAMVMKHMKSWLFEEVEKVRKEAKIDDIDLIQSINVFYTFYGKNTYSIMILIIILKVNLSG